jgi:hypothetical protein
MVRSQNSVQSLAARFMLLGRDPRFNRVFRAEHCREVFAEHVTTKKKFVPRTIVFLSFCLKLFSGKSYGDAKTHQNSTTLTRRLNDRSIYFSANALLEQCMGFNSKIEAQKYLSDWLKNNKEVIDTFCKLDSHLVCKVSLLLQIDHFSPT